VIGIEKNLRDALAVAQVDEDEVSHVTPPGYPSHQQDRVSGLLRRQSATVVSSFQRT
jgi:hypothetical protein